VGARLLFAILLVEHFVFAEKGDYLRADSRCAPLFGLSVALYCRNHRDDETLP
jgi:hypothetical protein